MTLLRADSGSPFLPVEQFVLPPYDTPSISANRVHNPNADIASYRAPSWPLAALDSGDRPSRTLHFAGWPQGFQDFARHVAYALINHGSPESFTERGGTNSTAWLSGASIDNTLHRLRAQIRWLTAEWSEQHETTPVRTPADMDPGHLDDLKVWLEQRYRDPTVLHKNLLDVVRIWHLNPWLPDHCRWPEPTWRHHKWQPKRGQHENRSVPIAESTFDPLLEWAAAFVSSFAPDILGAQSHYLQRLPSSPVGVSMGASNCLDQYLSKDQPLPPKPASLGGKTGMGVGWHVLEYRHAVPVQQFSNAFRRRHRKKRLRISSDFEETALDTPITGKFRGKTWIPFISVYDTTFAGAGKNALDAGPLVSHLRTACLIVTAALTGMRPEEVLNLTYGCAQEPLPRPGGSRLQLINGHVYKGVHQQENGSPGEPQPAVWATIPLAASAIQCAERINDSLGRDRGLLFSDSGSRTIYTRTATTWIASFIDFVNARLVPHTESQGALTIPRDPQGAVTLKRFRRTLAWFLRHRPNGDVTTAIQYQHVSVAMGAGYAGTKESGMPDLVLEEDWNHRRKTIQHVGELLSDGKGIAGPAAERALEAVDQLPRELLPADERRLKKDKSLMIYENPAALALCIFREEDALCQKLKRSGRDSQPDLLGCVEGCKNCARTDEHLERLTLKAAGQRKQAELAPLPMAQSLRAEADENDRIVVEFSLTRRTAGRSAQAAAVHAGQGSEEGITADEC